VFAGLGADVELQAPVLGAPDLVFTANAAIVLDGKVLLARFLDDELRIEEPFNEAFFKNLAGKGLLRDVRTLPRGMYQEAPVIAAGTRRAVISGPVTVNAHGSKQSI
jgi:N-dimethylarginine dimethylaminohydrolase